jgi:hypothetical protein
MNQSKIVDLDVWFRNGGINWDLTKLNQDVVAIQAGIGTWQNPLLKEQVDGAYANGVPYFTWWIPDISDGPITSQVDFYLSLYGVRASATCIDIEPPWGGMRCVNASEALAANHRVEDITGYQPLNYSNKKYITEDLKTPAWLPDYWWWIAQYIYKPWSISFYTDYTSFLAKYANKLPQTAYDLGLASKVIGWQFTMKGNAQALCANAKTLDPIYIYGIKECDCSVSTIEKDDFLHRIQLGSILPPPPPPIEGTWYIVNVPERNIRYQPNAVTGKIITTLHSMNWVKISKIVSGFPGQWGVTIAYSINGVISPCLGNYIYMNNLTTQ